MKDRSRENEANVRGLSEKVSDLIEPGYIVMAFSRLQAHFSGRIY